MEDVTATPDTQTIRPTTSPAAPITKPLANPAAAGQPAPAGPDLGTIKTRQQAMWASGDYGKIGTRLQIVGEMLCEAVDVLAFEEVLDVAAGNGNASLAAARRFARVTSTDYVPALLEQGRRRAAADGMEMEVREADVESLPFPPASFDAVLSVFGVMFSPDQERAAGEMLRVLRPGGRIGLASWTPEGFLGDFFRVIGAFVPPPAGLRSPMAWGTETRLVELFGPQASDIRTQRRCYNFRYETADHFIDYFRDWYGPTHRVFGTLDEQKSLELRAALRDLLESKNQRPGRSLVVPGEYLEAIITK